MKHLSTFLLSLLPTVLLAQQVTPTNQLLQQSQQRQALIDSQLSPSSAAPSGLSIEPIELSTTDTDHRCFAIETLVLTRIDGGAFTLPFDDYAMRALKTSGINYQSMTPQQFKLSSVTGQSPCLGVVDIQNLSTRIQNRLIDAGWVTSRVLIPNQDLSKGSLTLSLAEGQLGDITVVGDDMVATHAHRANTYTAFAMSSGEVLNLRDIEQGLENLRRLPTVQAEVDIVPGKLANTSDIAVKWQQRRYPFRFYLSMDDSGAKSTGKYLGTVSMAWDNPLHLNDIFSASYTHNLSHGEKQTDPQGHVDKGRTNNYSVNYSLPFGYWSFDTGMSHYYYDQVVAGLNRNYHYSGDSNQGHANLSRVLYRDSRHKVTAGAGLWQKASRSYLDDAEIAVQRRRTGGWQANISQRSYFKPGTLTSTLTYKRGTRAFGAITAPEELFNEGTAKSKLWIADVDWQMPFSVGNSRFNWHSQFHGQWNKTKLTPQDKLAIGGRYSIRGFSGEKSLSAERGWYLRNTIAWQYAEHHQWYLGLDTGHVSGVSATDLPGRSLTGGVLGMKGKISYHGDWHYDVFVGTAINEPTGFDADDVVSGFNVTYSF